MNLRKIFILLILSIKTISEEIADEEKFSPEKSVVRIQAIIQRWNYALPWQTEDILTGIGSGTVIKGKRILTNAHIVSDAKFILVQKNNDYKQYNASVEFIAHDCDLATLKIEDEKFFEGTIPLELADFIPRLNETVIVVGFPVGGKHISITRGVVSRIDYSTYTHSEVDEHLVIQVDAAINPGNSGGPVIYKNKIVGVAFQSLWWGENIGYAIPVPVIEHFLKDIEDGIYHGYPELGIGFMELKNNALKLSRRLPQDTGGILVHYVDPFGSAYGFIQTNDIIVSIDDYPIADDGTILMDQRRLLFAEIIERKQWGQTCKIKFLRNGVLDTVSIPLTNPSDPPFTFRNIYDRRPEYVVVAGMVFCPLTRQGFKALSRKIGSQQANILFYYVRYVKIDGYYKDRNQFIVCFDHLPHPVNTYNRKFVGKIVDEINGVKIADISQFVKMIKNNTNDFLVIKFFDDPDELILESSSLSEINKKIMNQYGIISEYYVESSN